MITRNRRRCCLLLSTSLLLFLRSLLIGASFGLKHLLLLLTRSRLFLITGYSDFLFRIRRFRFRLRRFLLAKCRCQCVNVDVAATATKYHIVSDGDIITRRRRRAVRKAWNRPRIESTTSTAAFHTHATPQRWWRPLSFHRSGHHRRRRPRACMCIRMCMCVCMFECATKVSIAAEGSVVVKSMEALTVVLQCTMMI
jgi:hypothetical protein